MTKSSQQRAPQLGSLPLGTSHFPGRVSLGPSLHQRIMSLPAPLTLLDGFSFAALQSPVDRMLGDGVEGDVSQ